ncbi:MAG: ASCH domain-containing protein [Deltaproteobacteria bacterium]|nr:ASCH domain-containing protein [Deltaproteobacteria bacterium]
MSVARWSKDLVPGDEVAAISLWEPWASLMALGAKKVETRSWRTRYRGPLLICASRRRRVGELKKLLLDPTFQRSLAPLTPGRTVEVDDLAFGKAVALVDVYDCNTAECLLECGLAPLDHWFGDYSSGRFGWSTCGVRRLIPFPVRGRQGLFKVRLPDDLSEISL